MNIGERIKLRREELNISQEELAMKAGYKSRSSINKIEKDGRGLPQDKIQIIANILDVTPSYLMGWENEPTLLDRIIYLCEEKNITRNKMERDIGISNGASSKWKISSPSIEILQKLAEYFKVSLEYLMVGNENTINQNSLQDLDIRRIQRARNKMPEKDREKMMKLLEVSFEDYFGEDYIDEDDN